MPSTNSTVPLLLLPPVYPTLRLALDNQAMNVIPMSYLGQADKSQTFHEVTIRTGCSESGITLYIATV